MAAVRKAWLITLVLIVAIAGGSYLAYRGLRPPAPPPGIIYANGQIEVTEVTVRSETSGRVVAAPMVEGTALDEGALLAEVAGRELQAALAEARARAEAIERGRDALQDQLQTARHHLQTAEAEAGRYRTLRRRGVVTPQQLNEVENRFVEAQGQVRTLEARLARSAAEREAVQAEIRRLKIQIEKTRIEAPIQGTLLVKGIEVGELATPGTVIAVIGDLARPELKVYVREALIGRIRLGAPARVRVDAFPGRYFDARVERIDRRAQFTPREIHTPEERARTVFGVTLAVENPEGYLKPGMPADAWIRWDEQAPWPDELAVPE